MRRVDIVASLPAFLLAVVLISASPGPAMALILRRAALHGFRAAVPTVLGLELGLYVWALLAGAGLAALVAASQTAYLVLRVVGAAVLIYLGAQAWRAALRDRRTRTAEDDVPDPPRKAIEAQIITRLIALARERGKLMPGVRETLDAVRDAMGFSRP